MKDLDPERHDHEHLVNEVNSLRQMFQHARDLVLPKPIITKAVQNYVANTLQLTKPDIEKMVEQRIEKLITGWLFEHVKRSWLDKLISRGVASRTSQARPHALRCEDRTCRHCH